jgi:hypothetical protein
MANFKYVSSDKDRVCRICSDKIVRNTWAIVLLDCHVSPKKVDLHFHEGCFMRSLADAKHEYGELKNER